MTPDRLLQALESLADQLGVRVAYADLSTEDLSPRGGMCILRGERMVIIERSLSPQGKANVLAEGLRVFDLDDRFLLPEVREALGSSGDGGTTDATKRRQAM